MTTPPDPNDDTPEHGFVPPAYGPQSFEPQGPPPGYPPPPPQGYPVYQYPPGYPYGPPPPQPRISAVMVILGPFLYAALNLVIGFIAFIGAGSTDNPDIVLGGTAVLLALIAFGGGATMLFSKNPTTKGLGIGLMVGWALVSLFTAGLCTGINPDLYSI